LRACLSLGIACASIQVDNFLAEPLFVGVAIDVLPISYGMGLLPSDTGIEHDKPDQMPSGYG
jgi:hypothetical protein